MDTQNLRTLNQGKLDYQSVAWALQGMDSMGSERLLTVRPGAGAVLAAGTEDGAPGASSERRAPQPPSPSYPVLSEGGDDIDGGSETDNEGADDDEMDEAALMAELEGLDLYQGQLEETLAMIASRPPARTWKQNKEFKRAAKRDRSYFGGGRPKASAPPPPKPRRERRPFADKKLRRSSRGHPRRILEQQIEITRCKTCHQKGHWS